jgi:hypothetical protein
MWYYNLKANPDAVTIQDGADHLDFHVTRSPGTSGPSGGSERWRPIPPTPSTKPRLNARFRYSSLAGPDWADHFSRGRVHGA